MEYMLKIVGFTALNEAALIQTGSRVLVILLLAWVVFMLATRVIRALRLFMTGSAKDPEQAKRVDTLGRVLRYVVSIVIWIVAATLILSELGISIAPILAAAGVAGIAVGFGAQSLVKDYFTGIVLLIENQVRIGDVIEAGDRGGLVEELTLRYIRLRDYEGNVHFVPNGIITSVTSRSREFAQSVMDIGVAYRENVDEALELMRRVGVELREDPVFGPKIVGDIEMVGVDRWENSAVVLRCRLKVRPLEQWNVRREFLRRLKKVFDSHGVEIPFPHMTIYAGESKAGTAPPFRVRHEPAQARAGG